MKHASLVVAAVLACACSRVDGGAATGGCIASTTWASAARTNDLGVNDTATDTTGGLSLAQSFLVPGDPGSTKEVAAVSLPLYYNAAVGGTLTLTLRQNNAGVPGTTLTGSTVTKTTTSTVTSTSPILIQFDMSNVQSLAAGSTFWIVLEASYSQRSTPVIKWAADDGNTNSSAYANGLAKYEGDGSPVTLNTFSTGTLGSLRELGFSITCN